MLCVGREERQAAARHEIADERRDENGFAGAREARDAEADTGRQVIAEARLSIPDEIGVGEISQIAPRVIA
jgi:hypothetical protein